jgi:hypothetical protein
VGASRERTKSGDAHMLALDGAGVPPIGHFVRCAVVAFQRFGIELPGGVERTLAAHGMMPDLALWGDQPTFLHELVA